MYVYCICIDRLNRSNHRAHPEKNAFPLHSNIQHLKHSITYTLITNIYGTLLIKVFIFNDQRYTSIWSTQNKP